MPAPRPRPGILEIEPYVGGKSHTAAGGPAFKLSSNESAIGPSPKAVAAYHAEAAQLHRYPDGHCKALRAAIGRRYNIDPASIVCGAGSDELIGLIIRAYAGPGDEVIHTRHGFLIYMIQSLAAGATPVSVPERELTADVDAILAAVTSRTRIVFLANPNNPTGTYLPAGELRRLHAGLPPDVVLAIDAAYAEFASADDYDPGLELALTQPNVVMTRTFSKLYGLAALRLGWMVAGRAVVDVMDRIRMPFNVGLPTQAAGIAAIEDLDHQAAARAHNDAWLPWMTGEIAALGIKVHPSIGNFLLAEFADVATATAANAFLESRNVIPRQVAAYGLPSCLRISVGLEAENRAAVDALRAFVAGRPS